MRRVLILGCSHAEVPLVQAAKRLGCEVGVVGNVEGGVASSLADLSHMVDYSNLEQVLRVFDDYSYDSVVAGCNDFAAFTRSGLGEIRGIGRVDTPAQTAAIHLKDLFRSLCLSLGISCPAAQSVDASRYKNGDLSTLTFPVIVKPTDLTGGKGISICESSSEVRAAIALAVNRSRLSRVVVEEYVTGSLHSACFWLYKGKPKLLTHADEFMYHNPFLVASAIAPSSVSSEMLSALSDDVARIVEHQSLVDGIFHVQFLVSGARYSVLEICRRPPGDLYLLLPTFFEDVQIADLLVRDALGIEIQFPEPQISVRPTLRLCLMADRNAAVAHWELSAELSQIRSELFVLRTPPMTVTDHQNDKLGIVIASSGDQQLLMRLARNPSVGLSVTYDE